MGYYTSGTYSSAGCTGLGWLQIGPGQTLDGRYVNPNTGKVWISIAEQEAGIGPHDRALRVVRMSANADRLSD